VHTFGNAWGTWLLPSELGFCTCSCITLVCIYSPGLKSIIHIHMNST
jgi:hypothetical protein